MPLSGICRLALVDEALEEVVGGELHAHVGHGSHQRRRESAVVHGPSLVLGQLDVAVPGVAVLPGDAPGALHLQPPPDRVVGVREDGGQHAGTAAAQDLAGEVGLGVDVVGQQRREDVVAAELDALVGQRAEERGADAAEQRARALLAQRAHEGVRDAAVHEVLPDLAGYARADQVQRVRDDGGREARERAGHEGPPGRQRAAAARVQAAELVLVEVGEGEEHGLVRHHAHAGRHVAAPEAQHALAAQDAARGLQHAHALARLAHDLHALEGRHHRLGHDAGAAARRHLLELPRVPPERRRAGGGGRRGHRQEGECACLSHKFSQKVVTRAGIEGTQEGIASTIERRASTCGSDGISWGLLDERETRGRSIK
ncbi:unnamed protein product [Phytophthora lilii]|uniref:Unnamed protein product n=1 Tax=Phytophthora lilii TaxID=2077276 RepID=A0A9W6TGP1_9STRA|nr:unnamed protein product [Phytophthora lilii]